MKTDCEIIKENNAGLKDYLLEHAISKAEIGENKANNKVAYSKKYFFHPI